MYTVKMARISKNYSQRKMAELMGVCVDTWRKIERCPDSATVKQGKMIAEITGIPYDQIFFSNNSTLSR
jgi:DNA-binding XRE family transcriptional regulator